MSSFWLYDTGNVVSFAISFVVLLAFSGAGLWVGRRYLGREAEANKRFLADSIPATTLGMLSLILGFTFSLAISRYEHRRENVIHEANAIGTARLRVDALAWPKRASIAVALKGYLDSRIRYYEHFTEADRRIQIQHETDGWQDRIWRLALEATRDHRTLFENQFLSSLTEMFDLGHERNFQLGRTLPATIYLAILLIAGVGLFALNFVRGQKRERGIWQPTILILMISVFFNLILNIDRPTSGTIQISQIAMTELRDQWK